MKYVLNQKQMQMVDAYSINEVGIPSMVLMERAALGVCEVIKKKYGALCRVLSVCGVGNNGADAIACARILAQEGYDTAICVIGNEEKASVEWKQQYQIAQKMGIRIGTLDDLSAYDVIIDGIFGIGLTRRVEGNYAAAIAQINESGRNVVSVDIPSGVHATTGQILGVAIGSTDTVTFGYAKLGHLFYPGAARTGELTVWNCGFAKEAEDILDRKCFYYEPKDVRRIGSRRPDANKGNYGKVLVIAGCEHMSGAAFFSGKAAYRCGAGLVKILTSKENEPALKKLFPEAVLGFYDGMDKEDLKKEIDWATQVVLGPGLSTGEKAEKIVEWTLQLCEETKLLLDADALNIIAKKGFLGMVKGHVLTPHLGEMSRLSGLDIASIKENNIAVAEEFATRYQCVLVMKDARTVVTDGTRTYVNVSGNDGMATGGSGDVLTGMIAGMWANGMDLMDGAILGVYLHGLAGDATREKMGPYAMTAGDILDHIHCVLLD